ncbi:helix-turn-helix domain-containing protein [Streptomyces sp. NPDC004647]|uniref:telomere-associated protein Tap n=1 Tax=Streptomyces sp. NPDC004647 TaxID=3154671 RepID=UPI0033A8AB87
MSEPFDAIDALIAGQAVLPPPTERERLRKAHGLSQEQVAKAMKVRRATLVNWESGKTEPRPPQREVYAHFLTELAKLYPANAAAPEQVTAPEAPAAEPVPEAFTGPAPQQAGAAASAAPAPAVKKAAATRPTSTSRRPVKKAAPARMAATVAANDARFTNGPLAVLDGDGTAYCPGGLVLECPAKTLPQLVEWTLSEARLGAARLHRSGKDADPLIVLTEAAAVQLGLPAELTDRRGLRLPDDHPVIKELGRAKWQLTRRGFGPWPRIYRPAISGQRQCVQLAVLPWGALDPRDWGKSWVAQVAGGQVPAAEIARVLGTYATRVLPPRGGGATCGVALMEALRPPTRAVKDEATGTYVSGPMPGSLTAPVDPAPPEAPPEHPVPYALWGRDRPEDQALDEEAYEWIRDPELLTDAECARAFAVGIDVNMAFAAAANRLIVGLGAPVHVKAPVFDKKLPGSWRVDLSHIELDPRLPNPFTPHGDQPAGPAWYATPTLAYALELGASVEPIEAWIRPENGPYLDPWYARLRDAYMHTMIELGVAGDLDEPDFLAAMERHKSVDPGLAAVLTAIKATVKGGVGKLRERPQGARYRPGDRWSALDRPTWRPDIRAAVISTARVNMHRKMAKLAAAADLYPIALLSDCVVYLSDGPSPVDVLPRTPDGRPVPGGFRLGVSPGMVKHEGTQPFLWAAEMLDAGHNPARHIKGTDAVVDGGE